MDKIITFETPVLIVRDKETHGVDAFDEMMKEELKKARGKKK